MIRYSTEHLWVRLDDDGQTALAGITAHAQETLGEIVLVDVVARGRQAEHTVIGSVESVKTASDLHMPLEAEIVAINEALREHPERVNEDPLGAGWMFRLAGLDLARLQTLMDEQAYQAHLGA